MLGHNIVPHIHGHNIHVSMLIKSNLFKVKRMIIRADHDHSTVMILLHNTLILPALVKQTKFLSHNQNVFIFIFTGFHQGLGTMQFDQLQGRFCPLGLLAEGFPFKEVQFKQFCPPVKTSCPPAENINETPAKEQIGRAHV